MEALKMNSALTRFVLNARTLTIAAFAAASAAGLAIAGPLQLTLTGDQEVPAVTTSAKGTGTVTIGADKSVSGSVTTTGIEGIAAHVHLAAPGKNGPPI